MSRPSPLVVLALASALLAGVAAACGTSSTSEEGSSGGATDGGPPTGRSADGQSPDPPNPFPAEDTCRPSGGTCLCGACSASRGTFEANDKQCPEESQGVCGWVCCMPIVDGGADAGDAS